MKSKGIISMNIMRIALLLIFFGLFLPLSCNSNGFQIAQGILGNSRIGNDAIFLSPVNDAYAYLLFAVFITAAVGFIITFINNINNNFLFAFICLVASLLFMFIILQKFKIYFNFNEFSFYVNVIFPVRIRLLIGGYVMIIGYIGGIGAFMLKNLKVIE